MLYQLRNLQSRAASAENPTAEKGMGGRAQNGRKGAPCIWPFRSGETAVLLDTEGPGMIRHIWCTIPPGNVQAMRNLILRMYWDGQEHPSVEVPLGDFFGVAHGRQRSLITDLVCMQDARGFNCWIPMPFRRHARITIENDAGTDLSMLFYQIDFTTGDDTDPDAGYFHAQFRRQNPCPMSEDYVILDGVSGRGVYLGTVLGIRSLYSGAWWGEGEVKCYMDGDTAYPTLCGTGTEDYMGSAWGLNEVVTPYQGCPLADPATGLYSLYRFHVRDPIYFQTSLRVTIQQIGFGLAGAAQAHYGDRFVRHTAAGLEAEDERCYFDRSDDYSSVALWYQTLPSQPFPAIPSRAQRSADLMASAEKGPERADGML